MAEQTTIDISSKEHALAVYRAMLRARILETKLGNLYKAGKIVGGVYLGKGQEAVSASLGTCLEWGKDVFAPLIRDQAGRMAFGEDPLDTTRTYLGSAKGPMRGRDGNIHRGRPQDGMFAMISHLGAAVAQVGGALLAKRLKGELDGRVGATCIGDGATSTGAFHEGLNFVAVEKLPMVVVVADNQFAYSTPSERQYACENLIDRAKGYGVGGHFVDGTDVLTCIEVIGHAVEQARAGGGPQLVVAKLLRLSGHGEHDDGSYVPQQIREGLYGRDCIEVGREQLIEKGWLSEEEYQQWVEEINAEAQEAVAVAQREDAPNPYKEDWSATASESLRGLQ
ncbi:thiamine pyrophosphate-dependent dehydrogenase E1 component subunit alpha [Rubritalea spongiae]|uniref:2-oxoisovalerate dehydrogenase subunit alpha n=1 Tax=Rubritalea spongiae TaxID=430797 RepID=A0ABW5E5F6_9BACT